MLKEWRLFLKTLFQILKRKIMTMIKKHLNFHLFDCLSLFRHMETILYLYVGLEVIK